MVERLAPGEDVSFTQPSGAGSFDGLSRHQLHAIAAAYGLTYDEADVRAQKILEGGPTRFHRDTACVHSKLALRG
jgi:hypothetical protein